MAHRLSTIKDADLIYVLHQGRVVEEGTHRQLMADRGRYWALWRAQTDDPEDRRRFSAATGPAAERPRDGPRRRVGPCVMPSSWISPTARSSARCSRHVPRWSSTARRCCWSALLGTALGWSALTQANLVVRAPGRVRPVTTPVKVFNAARGEILGTSTGGRVVEVNVRQGDVVRRGAVLVRLETAWLDNVIAKQRRTIRAGEEELARLAQLEELMTRQYAVSRAKAEAELAQAREAVRLAQGRRDVEIRLAELAREAAEA